MRMTLYVIACSEQHIAGTRMAIDAYDSRQHRLVARELMDRTLCGDTVLVLSAHYGFVNAFSSIDGGYNRKLTQARSLELASDSAQHRAFLEALEGHDEVKVYGGREYRSLVAAMTPDGVDVEELVGADRGCGDHFSALQWEFAGQYQG